MVRRTRRGSRWRSKQPATEQNPQANQVVIFESYLQSLFAQITTHGRVLREYNPWQQLGPDSTRGNRCLVPHLQVLGHLKEGHQCRWTYLSKVLTWQLSNQYYSCKVFSAWKNSTCTNWVGYPRFTRRPWSEKKCSKGGSNFENLNWGASLG